MLANVLAHGVVQLLSYLNKGKIKMGWGRKGSKWGSDLCRAVVPSQVLPPQSPGAPRGTIWHNPRQFAPSNTRTPWESSFQATFNASCLPVSKFYSFIMSSSSLQMKNLTHFYVHIYLYIFVSRPSCVCVEIHERLYPTGPSQRVWSPALCNFPHSGEEQTALLAEQGCLNPNPYG